jgi:hypothetical protein
MDNSLTPWEQGQATAHNSALHFVIFAFPFDAI